MHKKYKKKTYFNNFINFEVYIGQNQCIIQMTVYKKLMTPNYVIVYRAPKPQRHRIKDLPMLMYTIADCLYSQLWKKDESVWGMNDSNISMIDD